MKKLFLIFLTLAIPTLSIADNRDTHERLNAVLWMQTSAEYKTLCLQTYDQAWSQLDNMLSKAKHDNDVISAAIEQHGFNTDKLPYAVILDVDETVLDNSPMWGKLIQSGTGYSLEKWVQWVNKESAEFVPGAEEFINKARAASVEVIFITNRSKEQERHTINDLQPLIVTDSQILTSGEKETFFSTPWTGEKSLRRTSVSKKYWIIGMIGDDLGDFIPDIRTMKPEQRIIEAAKYQQRFGSQWFLMPNPIYGSWESVLYNRKDNDEKQLLDKMNYIKSYE